MPALSKVTRVASAVDRLEWIERVVTDVRGELLRAELATAVERARARDLLVGIDRVFGAIGAACAVADACLKRDADPRPLEEMVVAIEDLFVGVVGELVLLAEAGAA